MGLSVGTRLGPYEILSPLGAGGMGEVYRAKDTRLDRTVAIKVLPSHLSSSPDLKQRFDREAKSISQLQHPHICTLFDVGSQNGVDFLVMEYLEGETLADRLKRGPLPFPQLLKIAIDLAEALEKAHHAGLIHRDIKPGNIMLTKSGAKLLDFGLAKPFAIQAGAVASGSGSASPLLSGALTQSSPAAALTSVGTVVGTVQYMSPEQIAGQEADVRSDIFCFGAVLYEAAAGERAFKGKTPSAVVGAILANDPPPVSSLQSTVPPAFDRVVQTCLAKDPEERFESAHDLKLQLEWVRDFGSQETPSASASADWKQLAWKLGAAAAVGMLLAWAALASYTPQRAEKMIVAEISAPPRMTFSSIGDLAGAPTISPLGDKVAFVAAGADNVQTLWVRSIDGLSSVQMDGTQGAAHPFWSPDGKSIGFFTITKLKRISADGGPAVELCDATNPRGGTWGKDNVILFAPDFRGGIFQINAAGGKPSAVTTIDTKIHTTHRWPFFLPDGKHFLYFATQHNGGSADANGIYFASIDGKENRLILPSDSGGEYAAGYLLFHDHSGLMAQPFDPSSGKLSGTPTAVQASVRYDSGTWRSIFSVSQAGLLIFQPASSAAAGTQMAWFDRSGKLIKNVGQKLNQTDLRLSPDGKKAVTLAGDPFWEVWVIDLDRESRTRITYNEGTPANPAWSPDGKNLVFAVTNSAGGGMFDLHEKSASGSGGEQKLNEQSHTYAFPDWTKDGKYLTYISTSGTGNGQKGTELWAMPMEGDRKPFVAVQPPSVDSNILMGRVSPDSKWVVYASDETGHPEVYVASFPKGEGKWQVSTGGGAYPTWRGDGKEIFYSSLDNRFFSATIVSSGSDLQVGVPQALFHVGLIGNGFPYDVSADGQRFLVDQAEEATAAPLYLMVHWTAALKKN